MNQQLLEAIHKRKALSYSSVYLQKCALEDFKVAIKLFIDFWNFEPTNLPLIFFVSGTSTAAKAFSITEFFAALNTAMSSFGSLQNKPPNSDTG